MFWQSCLVADVLPMRLSGDRSSAACLQPADVLPMRLSGGLSFADSSQPADVLPMRLSGGSGALVRQGLGPHVHGCRNPSRIFRARHFAVPRLRAGARRLGGSFDSSLGFPGEGPAGASRGGRVAAVSSTTGASTLSIGTLNVTSWATWKRVQRQEAVAAQVWMIQEHKVCNGFKLRDAKKELAKGGWSSVFEPGIRTADGGFSSGVAVLVNQAANLVEELRISHLARRAVGAVFGHGGLRMAAWSLYGDTYDCKATEQGLKDALASSGGRQDHLVIGGDFNAPPWHRPAVD